MSIKEAHVEMERLCEMIADPATPLFKRVMIVSEAYELGRNTSKLEFATMLTGALKDREKKL